MGAWDDYLAALKAAGGSTDTQTSKTGRYPYLYHYCRGEKLVEIVIYASINNYPKPSTVLKSPPRDWNTKDMILADYRALAASGGRFNDSSEALGT